MEWNKEFRNCAHSKLWYVTVTACQRKRRTNCSTRTAGKKNGYLYEIGSLNAVYTKGKPRCVKDVNAKKKKNLQNSVLFSMLHNKLPPKLSDFKEQTIIGTVSMGQVVLAKWF